jgi:gamma-glutamyltranspeptidase/glutathione hydrolase
MLNILEGFDIAAMGHNSADYLHALVEAKRIAFADRAAYLGDPDGVPADLLRTLISKEYAAARRKEIDPARTTVVRDAVHSFAGLDRGDTIYLTAADGNGNAVSLIQSLFSDFGCGIVAGDTGIVLSNRGSSFNLTPGHPAAIGPRKRPPHTLIPAFVMKDGAPFFSFGVMGGDHQAQGHTQVLINLIDFGMNVQEAGEAARVTHGPNGLQVESAVPHDVRDALTRRGHTVFEGVGGLGGYQGIRIDRASGVLMGGSDVRKDGLAIGY